MLLYLLRIGIQKLMRKSSWTFRRGLLSTKIHVFGNTIDKYIIRINTRDQHQKNYQSRIIYNVPQDFNGTLRLIFFLLRIGCPSLKYMLKIDASLTENAHSTMRVFHRFYEIIES
ncbi:uncharacterized protein LOC107965799 [Apis mellifera]|uniref:Uncharacterized protein LOC107965799 n=1 Tax=Apis mellifera TaxID=7460 RepID=A0A7M7KZF9_APIME|nr:uncharacterized protein LOC107965799 [Apis mellifera]|eukprot:XP_026295373.1 uncharacterized protein LOC107965799 [Apis mellifera]